MTKPPCNPDHNGECLICDCWLSDCAYTRYLNGDYKWETKEELEQIFLKTMTDKQMDKFLESIGGLKNGYLTDGPPITSSWCFECDKGWYPLIKELIEDLIALGWDKRICQVKEKFGGLRFYINSGTDEIHKRISKAAEDSYTICERTGKPGKLRTDIGWYTTLCDEEYQKILERRNANN